MTLAADPSLPTTVEWHDGDVVQRLRWRSESGHVAPRRARCADDTLPADTAYRLACEGTALVWRGDFQNARQLLQALARRVERSQEAALQPKRVSKAKAAARAAAGPAGPEAPAQAFHRHRQAQSQRARVLAMLLIPLGGNYRIDLRRAPDWRSACVEAYGPADGVASLVPLRELLGVVGAHEWRKKGVPIDALGGEAIHPHYGVFSPVRGEYIALVARAALPPALRMLAFDIGTGTGVLAAVLARRGVLRVVATEVAPRALACAADNLRRLGLERQVELQPVDLFPVGRAPLIVCNPPWLPARPSSALEQAVYDPDGAMLHSFIDGLADHLAPQGEGWLLLSDLAEHLGLRTREALLDRIAAAGLRVAGRTEAQPIHPKAQDASDPLHAARAKETTSLWRLVAA